MKQSTHNKKFAILMIIIILLTMSISGCGGNQDTTPEVDVAFITNPDRSLFYGETLTIATAADWFFRPMARQYMAENPGVNVEIIDLGPSLGDVDSLANMQTQISIQLMAGSAPVLIDGIFVDHCDLRSAHFLTDWFPIMDADPNFNENDWFMNVFHASAVNDQLHVFPMKFSYEMVTANSTVPSLSGALAAQDSITLSELMELHREIPTDNPLFLDPNFDTSWVVQFYLDSFLDVETGWVDFDNDQFIDLITYAREITSPDKRFREQWMRNMIDPELETYWSEKYFFQTVTPATGQYFLRFETGPLFTELTPLVNVHGELLVSPWLSCVLNANATPIEQALAWEFIQFVMNPDNPRDSISMQPTNRHLSHYGWEPELTRTIHNVREEWGWQLTSTIDEAVEDVNARMMALGDMPMANTRTLPFAIENIIDEALELFHNGLVSAEQTAADLQNRVTLALMEMGIN